MTYGLVLGITLIHAGFLLSILAFWLAARAVAPGLVDHAEARVAARPMRQLLVGLLATLPLVVLGLVMANAPALPGLAPLGAGLLLLLLLAGLLGSSGIAQHVGRGLNSPVDDAQPWRRVLRGGLVVGFLLIFPLLGWFILLPAVLASGVGATLTWLLKRRPAAASAPVLAEG